MVDLNDCIGSQTGWTLQVAQAINNRGEIVGAGTIKGKSHAFLLKPRARGANKRTEINASSDPTGLLLSGD